MYKQGTGLPNDVPQTNKNIFSDKSFTQSILEGFGSSLSGIDMTHEDIMEDRLKSIATSLKTISETLIKTQETNAQLLKLLVESKLGPK